jgi:hypothetical protein
MTRDEVHALLGVPDADFSPKGWEAWDHPVLVGAWVLVVYYSESGAVTSSQTTFEWGLGYLRWDRSGHRGRPRDAA